MLFVALCQTLAVCLTITALWKDTLMWSPEEDGVTCQAPFYGRNITAQHLVVYWGWQSLSIRWDVEGHQDTQIWLTETYKKTKKVRCDGGSITTIKPTRSPIPTASPTKKPTKSPHTHRPTSPTKAPTEPTSAPLLFNATVSEYAASPTSTRTSRKLLQYEAYNEYGYAQPSHSDAVFSAPQAVFPSVFYSLPALQRTDSYGQSQMEYLYPLKISAAQSMDIDTDYVYNRPHPTTPPSTLRNGSNTTTAAPTSSPTLSPTDSTKNGCDDLEIVIETGKSYFSLLICGLICAAIGLILLMPPTCHLVSIKMRRVLKQIVIGLNTLSFMLLLMAFAIWFAYFSTNINEVVESTGNSKSSSGVCLLGSPMIGESVAYLLSGWILIGFSTIGSCYLSNRPKKWYRFLRQKRNYHEMGGAGGNHLNINGPIQEESSSEADSDNDENVPHNNYNRMADDRVSGDSESASDSQERLATMVNRTPSNHSSGSNDTYMTADHQSMSYYT